MLQDQLTRAERIRLESLSQACASAMLTMSAKPSLAELFQQAEHIEKWLKAAGDILNS